MTATKELSWNWKQHPQEQRGAEMGIRREEPSHREIQAVEMLESTSTEHPWDHCPPCEVFPSHAEEEERLPVPKGLQETWKAALGKGL